MSTPDSASTRYFTPYCVLTEQVTAASTAAKIDGMGERPLPDVVQYEQKRAADSMGDGRRSELFIRCDRRRLSRCT